MRTPKQFDIYLARFPFLDKNKHKLRPVIVASGTYSARRINITVPVSTKENNAETDFVISAQDKTNLTKRSIAQVHKLTALAQSEFVEYIGELSEPDKNKLKKSLKNLLNL
jgi:mRNA-degrading endonuclease toxin of MazEF toxin-antitoxin module